VSIQPAPTPFPRGPYLQAAVFCESVIEGNDGALSLIRLIDRVVVQASGPGAPDAMPQFNHNMVAVIVVKAGEARGTCTVRLEMEHPSGLRSQVATLTAMLEGEDRGQNLILRFTVPFRDQGLYWYNAYIDAVLTTRTPWRIIYMRATPHGPIVP
jgi:hypothetical protein